MKLNSLHMHNYRCYQGEHTVHFADADEKNVTLIIGQNGSGKTSLHSAVMFCLFGEKELIQSDEEGKVFLTNIDVVKRNKSKPTEGFLELCFTHNNYDYEVKRLFRAMLVEGESEPIESDFTLQVKITDPIGETLIYEDEDKFQTEIKKIINPRIRRYFLFNSERINNLTKADREQKQEVSSGIRNMLDINRMEQAHQALTKLCTMVNKEIGERSTGKSKQLSFQINEIDEKIEDKRSELSNAENENDIAAKRLDTINKELSHFNEIKEKVSKRDEAEKEANRLKKYRLELKDYFRSANGELATAPEMNVLSRIYKNVTTKIKNKEIPTPVQEDLLDLILNTTRVCICERGIDHGSKEEKALQSRRKSSISSQLQNGIMQLSTFCYVAIETNEQGKKQAHDALKKYDSLGQQVEEQQKIIKSLGEEIGDIKSEEIKNKENERVQVLVDIEVLSQRIKDLENEIKKLNANRESLIKERNQVMAEEGFIAQLNSELKLAENTKKAIIEIKDKFVKEIRAELQKQTTDIFKEIETDPTLDRVEIEDDYSLNIKRKTGERFLKNLSDGQRAVLSLAFTCALLRVAGGDDKLEMPLFIDAPFTAIDKHKPKLLKFLPSQATQLIICLLPKEFRNSDYDYLVSSKKFGQAYVVTRKNGVSDIKQKAVSGLMKDKDYLDVKAAIK